MLLSSLLQWGNIFVKLLLTVAWKSDCLLPKVEVLGNGRETKIKGTTFLSKLIVSDEFSK